MKKSILLISFILITFNLKSQNLTFDELLKLKNMNKGKAEEYLTRKPDWEFIGVDEEAESNKFAYKKNFYNDRASAFVLHKYGSISVQFQNKEKYLSCLNRLQSLGFKYESTETTDGGDIQKTYKGTQSMVTILISTSTDNDFSATKTIYYMIIRDKYWYEQ